MVIKFRGFVNGGFLGVSGKLWTTSGRSGSTETECPFFACNYFWFDTCGRTILLTGIR